MSRNYPSDWNQRRKSVYQRDEYECQNCGTKGGPRGNAELHAHHIVPKSSGGTHELSNLQTVCEDCHNAIHNKAQAPTATLTSDTDNSAEMSMPDKFLFDWSIRLTAIQILLGETKEEAPFETSHHQFGYLFYARRVFFDAHWDIVQFASRGEAVPEKLEKRYTTAQLFLRYILGKTDEVDHTAMTKLIDVSNVSDRPDEKFREVVAGEELSEMDTVYEMITDWNQNQPSTVPRSFDEFLRLTEEFVRLVDDEFTVYDDMVVIGPQGVVTLSGSVESQWRRKEIQDELEDVAPKWWGTFSNLSEKGIKRANKDEGPSKYRKDVEELGVGKRTIYILVAFVAGRICGLFLPFVDSLTFGILLAGIVLIMSSPKFVEVMEML